MAPRSSPTPSWAPQDHDLSRLIAGLNRTTEGLGRNEEQLKDLVTNFNRTVAATASEAVNLRASIRLLGPTLVNANSALDALNASFPNTRAFAREILPGVNQTAATIDAAFPWIAQAQKLLGPDELQGVVERAEPGDGRPGQGRRRDPATAAAGRSGRPSARRTSSCRPAT